MFYNRYFYLCKWGIVCATCYTSCYLWSCLLRLRKADVSRHHGNAFEGPPETLQIITVLSYRVILGGGRGASIGLPWCWETLVSRPVFVVFQKVGIDARKKRIKKFMHAKRVLFYVLHTWASFCMAKLMYAIQSFIA